MRQAWNEYDWQPQSWYGNSEYPIIIIQKTGSKNEKYQLKIAIRCKKAEETKKPI